MLFILNVDFIVHVLLQMLMLLYLRKNISHNYTYMHKKEQRSPVCN